MINVVCAIIRNPQGEVLACQRPEGKLFAGKWEFPGGKIEPGEHPEHALSREILEELKTISSIRTTRVQSNWRTTDGALAEKR